MKDPASVIIPGSIAFLYEKALKEQERLAVITSSLELQVTKQDINDKSAVSATLF